MQGKTNLIKLNVILVLKGIYGGSYEELALRGKVYTLQMSCQCLFVGYFLDGSYK